MIRSRRTTLFQTLLVNSRVLTGLLLVVSVGALAVPAFFLRNPFTVILPSATLSASMLATYHHYRSPSLLSVELESNGTRPLKLIYTAWFVACGLAILLYHANGFARSLSVNTLLLLTYVLVLSSIFFTDRHVIVWSFLLLTAIFHRALIYFANPLPYGVDPHFHYANAHLIAQTGTLQPLHATKELFAPFFHVNGAIGSLILNLTVRDGAMFFTLLVAITAITGLLLYHLTSTFWNEPIAIITSLLYFTGDYSTGSVLSLGTTEFALAFFVVLLYALLWYVVTGSNRYLATFGAAFFAITFTHHGSVFVATCSVITFCFVGILLSGVPRRFVNLSVLSGSVLVFSWTATALGKGTVSFLDWILLSLINSFRYSWTTGDGPSPESFGFVSSSPMASSGYLDVLGTGLLFFFAGFGILYWLIHRDDTTEDLIIALGAVMTFIVAMMFVGSVLGISSFVPSRWFKHVYFLLAMPAGVGLWALLSMLPGRCRRRSVVLSCLLALSVPYLILMGGSFVGSPDDPIFNDAPGAERMSYTEPEAATFEYTLEYGGEDTNVVGDHFATGPIRWDRTETGPDKMRLRIMPREDKIITFPGKTMLINRQHMYSGHAKFDIWAQELEGQPPLSVRGTVPIQQSMLDEYQKVYQAEDTTCGETSCGVYTD